MFCDIIVKGVARLPEWGEEVFGDEPVLCPGGVANVAVGLARLGLATRLLARTRADDTIGSVLAEELGRYAGLTVTWLQSAPSTALTVALPQGSERAMISYIPPADDRPLAPLIDWDALGRIGHVHVGSWNEGARLLDDQEAILVAARGRAITTSLDVSWQQAPGRAQTILSLLRHVDLFIPNRVEACQIAGTDDPVDALERLAALVPTVVVKLGGDGAIASRGGVVARVGGLAVPVVDTTGAGDAFAAGFLHGYLRRWSLARCLELANACGALSVGRVGSSISVPTRREVFAAMERGRLDTAAS